MAKLYFRYGAMGCSKTANALVVRFNYEERGRHPLILKPIKDTRDGKKFKSRIAGLEHDCGYFEEFKLSEIVKFDCIIVDEAQFLTRAQVKKLCKVVDNYNIPVICYGLRADFQGKLFTGSKALFEFADSIEELKTICWCGRKAIMNARFDSNKKIIRDGKQCVIGANDMYVGLCRKHWAEGNLGNDKV